MVRGVVRSPLCHLGEARLAGRGGIGASLAVTVAVLVLVALFLIPAYQGNLKQRRMTEVAAAAGACKQRVADYARDRKAFPADARQAGCSRGDSRHVSDVRVSGGRVEAVIHGIDPSIEGRSLVLEATKDEAASRRAAAGEPIQGWHCSTTAEPESFKYFPASCRRNPLPP